MNYTITIQNYLKNVQNWLKSKIVKDQQTNRPMQRTDWPTDRPTDHENDLKINSNDLKTVNEPYFDPTDRVETRAREYERQSYSTTSGDRISSSNGGFAISWISSCVSAPVYVAIKP